MYSCALPPVSGKCLAYMPRYYFDPETKSCTRFVYGGCLGNCNKFISCFYKANIKKGVQNRETWYIKDSECKKLDPGYVIHDCTGYFNKKDCEHCLIGEDYS
uniref:(California timema) hypothetical protein n=1 Tax=Timema californicum TaxID=61474 RepID=A0A7R9JG96_TIMCA|nr:unnamed protein product [Timema californicum]